MRRKLVYLLFLLIVAGIVIGVKVIILDAGESRVGHLQIEAMPDATVFVNSQAVGRTPLNQQMPPGEYTVKLIPIAEEGESPDSVGVSWSGKVQVSAFQYTSVRRELQNTEVESAGEVLSIRRSANILSAGTGEILIETEPDGAIVSYDGQDMGVSPYLVKQVPEGVHEISVYAPRYRRRSRKVRVVSGGYTTVAHFQLGLDVEYDKKFAFGLAFEASRSATLPDVSKAPPTATPTPKVKDIEVLDTPTGYLRVRDTGSLTGKEISQIRPGEVYPFLEEIDSWIKIKLTDGQEGWVKGEYVKKLYAVEGE